MVRTERNGLRFPGGFCALLAAVLAWPGLSRQAAAAEGGGPPVEIRTFQRAELRIRDPFILPLPGGGLYVMYGTNGRTPGRAPGPGFDAFTTKDFERFEGPRRVFQPPAGYWGTQDFWAPEVHAHRGRYYLFASFKSPQVRRGTAILVSEGPLRPFRPHSDGAVTPRNWECLDGTFWVEEGVPWMVFCHEWVQVRDGRMCAVRLSDDLRRAVGEPIDLFKASDAPWCNLQGRAKPDATFVTDGPFVFTTPKGKLRMLWSSFTAKGYGLACAESEGGIRGPWKQQPAPIFDRDGGHGMIFRTHEGALRLSLHQPNRGPNERACFFDVRWTGDELAPIP